MGAAKMRPGKKGRSVARTLVAAALAAAAVVTLVIIGSPTALADVLWTYGAR